MNTIGIGQLRGDLRNYVERVANGETFRVLRRGRPVATLYAVEGKNPMVIPVRLADLREHAASYFDRVEAGETVTVEYQGCAVAALRSYRGDN